MRMVLFCLLFLFPAKKSEIHLRDGSDWWSKLAILLDTEAESAETPPGVLRIAGISLDREGFSGVAAKLGESVAVTRGDASTGRKQLCYASPKKSVHLVFEEGEVYNAYYLFAGRRDWNGSEYCHKTDLVSAETGNAAGLHLGMSPAEVQGILGKPLIADPRRMIYSRATQRQAATASGHSDVDVRIEARFDAAKLIYLAVVKSETN